MPVQTVIKTRRDTAANWISTNPTLAAGEMGLETDTNLFKFGNGTDVWTGLNYSSSSRTTQIAKNDTGASAAKGSVVYISGANGANALFSLADADTELTSSKTVGLLAQTLATNGIGAIVTEGLLSGVNTGSATAGQSVWLSGTAGEFVFNAPPAKPAHSVYLGVVTRAHSTQGEILVKVQNGYELEELHNVSITDAANGQTLIYDSTAGLWENGSIDVPNSGWQTITVSDASPNVTLTAASPLETRITGTLAAAGLVYLPDCTTLQVGDRFIIRNNTSTAGGSLGAMYARFGDDSQQTIQSGAFEYTCIDNSIPGNASNWQRVAVLNGNINGTGPVLGTTNPGLVVPIINGAVEPFVPANGNQTFDAATPIRISLAPTANMTVNFRYSSTLTLAANPAFVQNRSITFVYMVKNGATPYYPTSWSMDGTAFTPKWLGGTAPTAGNANATDVYTITIMRTGASTYEYFGSVSKFA